MTAPMSAAILNSMSSCLNYLESSCIILTTINVDWEFLLEDYLSSSLRFPSIITRDHTICDGNINHCHFYHSWCYWFVSFTLFILLTVRVCPVPNSDKWQNILWHNRSRQTSFTCNCTKLCLTTGIYFWGEISMLLAHWLWALQFNRWPFSTTWHSFTLARNNFSSSELATILPMWSQYIITYSTCSHQCALERRTHRTLSCHTMAEPLNNHNVMSAKESSSILN